MPGVRPTTISTSPNCADSPASSRSHASASSNAAVRHSAWARAGAGGGGLAGRGAGPGCRGRFGGIFVEGGNEGGGEGKDRLPRGGAAGVEDVHAVGPQALLRPRGQPPRRSRARGQVLVA